MMMVTGGVDEDAATWTRLTCMTLGRMVLLKWSSRVGALKSLLYTSSSSS